MLIRIATRYHLVFSNSDGQAECSLGRLIMCDINVKCKSVFVCSCSSLIHGTVFINLPQLLHTGHFLADLHEKGGILITLIQFDIYANPTHCDVYVVPILGQCVCWPYTYSCNLILNWFLYWPTTYLCNLILSQFLCWPIIFSLNLIKSWFLYWPNT